MKEFAKNRTINRQDWASGPWDNEPDYYEWTTAAGYEAYLFRLDTGTWVGNIIAPYPTEGTTLMAFSHTLRDKRWRQFDHRIGLISKTETDGIGEFGLSMEHYSSPSNPTKESHGPYKTMEETKQICEDIAQDIFQTHKEGTYVNYFRC